MTVKKIKIVSGCFIDGVNSGINNAIDRGYQPHGEIRTCYDEEARDIYYTQVMAIYEEPVLI